MLDLLFMIGACTLLAYMVETKSRVFGCVRESIRQDFESKFLYLIIIVWICLFAGLRSRYNDTSAYMYSFSILTGKIDSFKIFSYGGYDLYRKLIKNYISANPQVFIFLSAAICCLLTIPFIVRHTKHFSASIFLFLISDFIFLMAGIKQAIAIAIGLWAFEAYLKRKYMRSVLLLILAISFHPYIICLSCIPWLKGVVWNKKTIILVIVFAVAFVNLDLLFDLLAFIGKDFSDENLNDYTINPFRVLVEFVPVAISFIYKDKIRKANDKFLNIGINMRIISFVFITLGLFYNPIYLGRMSTYFTMLSAIVIPRMLNVAFEGDKNKKVWILAYYCFFGLYFLLDLTKLGSYSLLQDQFGHVNIATLFK